MEAGIVGLPNVGKSTLFNALTSSTGAQAANYPFCTIEPNEGIVSVPDSRLDRIAAIIKPQRIIPAALKLVDIAGIVKERAKAKDLETSSSVTFAKLMPSCKLSVASKTMM